MCRSQGRERDADREGEWAAAVPLRGVYVCVSLPPPFSPVFGSIDELRVSDGGYYTYIYVCVCRSSARLKNKFFAIPDRFQSLPQVQDALRRAGLDSAGEGRVLC